MRRSCWRCGNIKYHVEKLWKHYTERLCANDVNANLWLTTSGKNRYVKLTYIKHHLHYYEICCGNTLGFQNEKVLFLPLYLHQKVKTPLAHYPICHTYILTRYCIVLYTQCIVFMHYEVWGTLARTESTCFMSDVISFSRFIMRNPEVGHTGAKPLVWMYIIAIE